MASWLRPEVGYVFGSMLPDFATMIRARLPTVRDARVCAGVETHHVVDEVFHGLQAFRTLCRTLGLKLIALGFDRGRARAVAHIGVEMLLDRPLADDPRACDLYWSALEESTPHGLGQSVAWSDEESIRFERLRMALRARWDAADGDARSTAVFRLERALQSRPRLALSPEQCETAAIWLVEAESAVSAGAAALVSELRSGLRSRRLAFAPD